MERKKIKIRQARLEDIPQILDVEKVTWGEKNAASKQMFESRIKTYPKGILVAEIDDKIVGVVATERINYDFNNKSCTWNEITDNGFIKNSHNPQGNIIYGVDLSVKPEFQNYGIGSKLLESIARLAITYNVKWGILGGRIPDYHKYVDKMNPEEYIKATVKTKKGIEPLDPEIRFYKRAGLKIIKLIPDYFNDPESLNYGIILQWENPFYNKWYRKIIAFLFKT